MRQVLVFMCACSSAVVAAAQGEVPSPREDYRIPAGFIYKDVSLSPKDARDLAQRHAVLTLLNVKNLSADVAAGLVTPYLDTFLTCPALESIDVKAAASLSVRRGYLRLWGLKSLTPEVAAALVASPGQGLELTGVSEISPEVARALVAGKRDQLGLGLTSLPADIADILAEFPGKIWFLRLEMVSPEAAAAMSKHRGTLDLGPAQISPEVAEELLRHAGPIGLTGVKRLAPGVGEILASHKSEVLLELEEIDSARLAAKLFQERNRSSSVENLRTMSAEIAAEYARHDPGYLLRLDTLSVEAAKELARSPRSLKFPAVSKISAQVATALTDRTAAVYLRGLKALDGPDAVQVAEALAGTPAPVVMENLERISAPALAALRKRATIAIPPEEKLTIVP
jgi:hypothetical protein